MVASGHARAQLIFMTDLLTEEAETEAPQVRPSPPQPRGRTGADHAAAHDEERAPQASRPRGVPLPREQDGPKGPEPTRYGDWEQKGRCTDF